MPGGWFVKTISQHCVKYKLKSESRNFKSNINHIAFKIYIKILHTPAKSASDYFKTHLSVTPSIRRVYYSSSSLSTDSIMNLSYFSSSSSSRNNKKKKKMYKRNIELNNITNISLSINPKFLYIIPPFSPSSFRIIMLRYQCQCYTYVRTYDSELSTISHKLCV